MNASALLQAVRGPVLLITLGVLLAADHFGAADFWRTWPVLLIVFGVMKLLETLARRPAEENRGNLS
jgi:hypothetical protein